MTDFKPTTRDAAELRSAEFGGLRGYVTATYEDLVKVFGPPNSESDPDKVACEWLLIFGDDTVVSVYSYTDAEPKIPKGLYQWHIGSTETRAVHYVAEALQRPDFDYVYSACGIPEHTDEFPTTCYHCLKPIPKGRLHYSICIERRTISRDPRDIFVLWAGGHSDFCLECVPKLRTYEEITHCGRCNAPFTFDDDEAVQTFDEAADEPDFDVDEHFEDTKTRWTRVLYKGKSYPSSVDIEHEEYLEASCEQCAPQKSLCSPPTE